jgi:protoporphyrinogen/coproporphyrinogen III oxidase
MRRPLVVVGGGITGLVAARTLARGAPKGTRTVLVEAADRLGGKILTHRFDGAAIEAGPDWFLTRGDVMRSLCRELGIETELVEPATSGALIWSRGGLRPMPTGFVRGVPASLTGLLSCDHLSIAGRLRAVADLVLPGPLTGPDISLGRLVRRRFGDELLTRLVDPIIAASRSGEPDRMSLAAAAPEIDSAARGSRSVMRALGRFLGGDPVPGFAGLAGGMESLAAALAADLGQTEVRLSTRLASVSPDDDGYRLSVYAGAPIEAGGLLMALPAPAAVSVLGSLDGELAAALASIRYTAAVVVSLIYPAGAVHAPPGASGFLVPSDEGRLVTAGAWYSAKWASARPGDGSFVMRCFAGRTPDDPALRMSDDDLIHRIANEVALITGVRVRHRAAFVNRWTHALPLYEVGHLDGVARIDRAAAKHPGLALAGAGFRGSGLPDCVAAGRAAAERILSH